MSSESLTKILSLLPDLTPSELVEVRERAKFLAGGPASAPLSKPATDLDILDTVILEEIGSVLRSKGIECLPPAVLRRSDVYKSYREKLPFIDNYLQYAKLERTRLRAFLEIGLDFLYGTLAHNFTVPIGARMMMANIHRLPEVVDLHFPGYAASGMLGAIVRKK